MNGICIGSLYLPSGPHGVLVGSWVSGGRLWGVSGTPRKDNFEEPGPETVV